MRHPIILLALIIPLCGCGALFSYDNREKVAMAIMFPRDDPKHDYLPDGQFDEKVFSNALLAIFPAGSPTENLKTFAASLNGHCEDPHAHRMRCFIPESGGLCYETTIEILVDLKNDSIADIHASRQGAGC